MPIFYLKKFLKAWNTLLSPPPFFKGEGQGGGGRHNEKPVIASPTPLLASPLEVRGEGSVRKTTPEKPIDKILDFLENL